MADELEELVKRNNYSRFHHKIFEIKGLINKLLI